MVKETSSVMKWNICEKKITLSIIIFYWHDIVSKKAVFQNTPDSRTLDINLNDPKSTNHFILPRKSSWKIKLPSSNQITTSNAFDLLSYNTVNSLVANNVMPVEDNAESFSNKSNKPNNTSIST